MRPNRRKNKTVRLYLKATRCRCPISKKYCFLLIHFWGLEAFKPLGTTDTACTLLRFCYEMVVPACAACMYNQV